MDFESLFEQWQSEHHFNAFIRDGIIDIASYEKPHVLFVLREMNCKSRMDQCDFIRNNGSGWKTWNNVGRWTHALLDGDEEYPSDMSEKKRIEQLKRVAFINLKKEGGNARTNGYELLNTVKQQKELICQEIELCDPDIIIGCGQPIKNCPGNADLLYRYVFSEHSEWDKFRSSRLPRDWWHYTATVNGKEIPVISFCHPQATNICGQRGHKNLFQPLYEDMLLIRQMFL